MVDSVERQRGARLGETAAFDDQDAGGMEELGDLAPEGHAARDGESEPPAQPRVNLREDEAVGQWQSRNLLIPASSCVTPRARVRARQGINAPDRRAACDAGSF
jgi:hypothetical protein